MANVLALFQTKNAGLKIGQEHAAFADYWNKLATETAARNAPDVMRMSMSYFAEYAQRGRLTSATSSARPSKQTA
jgi:multiple sugar transport system substrate-binding protein